MNRLEPFTVATTRQDSGTPLRDEMEQIHYWQQKAFYNEMRAENAEAAAMFYAACAILFFLCGAALVCVLAVIP